MLFLWGVCLWYFFLHYYSCVVLLFLKLKVKCIWWRPFKMLSCLQYAGWIFSTRLPLRCVASASERTMLNSARILPALPVSLVSHQAEQSRLLTPTHPLLPHLQPHHQRNPTGLPASSPHLLPEQKTLSVPRLRGPGPQHHIVRPCLQRFVIQKIKHPQSARNGNRV